MENKSKKTELFRAIKYTLIASSAGLIQVASFSLLAEVALLPYWPSYLVALLLSVIWNFTINRKYTFRTVASVPVAMAKVLGYYAIFTPLSTLWGEALVSIGWNDYLVLGLTMIVNLVTEYLFYLFVVYPHRIDNAIKEK